MDTIGLFIVHCARPGQRAAVQAIWEGRMASAVSDNPGHLDYFYCLDQDAPDVIRVFQRYASREAAEAFLSHPAYIAYQAEVEGHLAGPPDVTMTRVAWRKSSAEKK